MIVNKNRVKQKIIIEILVQIDYNDDYSYNNGKRNNMMMCCNDNDKNSNSIYNHNDNDKIMYDNLTIAII